jgi:hypothetical protein
MPVLLWILLVGCSSMHLRWLKHACHMLRIELNSYFASASNVHALSHDSQLRCWHLPT